MHITFLDLVVLATMGYVYPPLVLLMICAKVAARLVRAYQRQRVEEQPAIRVLDALPAVPQFNNPELDLLPVFPAVVLEPEPEAPNNRLRL